MYVSTDMANKSLDGLTIGTFDEVFVSEDVTIDGNLTVNGTITGGLGPSTDNYYLATDASNQFRANSSSVELKSETSTTPTFRMKNSANSTATSTLEVGQINTVTSNSGSFVATDATNQFKANASTVEIQSTTSSTPLFKLENNAGATTSSVLEVGQGNITTVNSTGISNSGTINSTTVTTGTLNATTSNTTGVATSGTSNTGELFVKNARLASNLDDLFLQANNSTVLIRPGSGSANELYNNSTETVIRDGSSNIAWRLTKSTSNVVQRGDLTVGNFDVNGARNLLISNQSSGTDAYSMLTFDANQNANAVLFLNGSGRLGDGGPNVMTMRNDAGDIRIVDATGVAIRLHSPGVTINAATSCFSLNATTSVAANTLSSTTSTSVGGALTVTGTTTLDSPMTQNNATDATDSLAGSIFTWGGLKTVKKMYAGGGVVIPYGQPLQSNTAFTNTKMLEAGYQITNGPIGDDAIYLYAPGNSPGSGSTFVLGANTNQVRLNQTTQATSTTTGALRVAGGVGIGGNLHVGGTITGGSVSYSTTSSGTFDVTNGTGTTLTVDSTEASTSTTTGCATFAGGVGIAGNLHVGGTITGGSISYASTSTGTLSVTNSPGTTVSVSSTEDSTTTTTGAVTVSGGLGVAKNTIIGGNIELGNTATNGRRSLTLKNSSLNSAADVAIVFDTANAQNAEIYMAGPNDPFNANDLIMRNNAGNLLFLGTTASFYLTNSFFVNARSNFLNADDAISYNNASTMLSGGMGIAKSVCVGKSITAGQIATTNPDEYNSIEVNNLSATGYALFKVNSGYIFSNGSNRTADGGAFTMTIRNDAGKLRLQNQGPQSTILLNGSLIESTKLEVTDTTQSTSTSTGALVVDGGLGVDKQAHIGGQLHCTATTSSTSTTTGCARFSGGIGVVENINVGGVVTAANEIGITRTGNAEMRVYNNGNQTEWVFGQRSDTDHDFTISSKVGATITPIARFNASGQLKLGNGTFFDYQEGTFLPGFDTIGLSNVVYTRRQGNYVRVGKQVTCSIAYEFTYITNQNGFLLFTDLIPVGTPYVYPVIHLNPGEQDLAPAVAEPCMLQFRTTVNWSEYVITPYTSPNTFVSSQGFGGTVMFKATYSYLMQ